MNNPMVWVIMLPLLASLITLAWPRRAHWIGLLFSVITLAFSMVLVYQVFNGGPQTHELGNWNAGLGIALRADALSASLLVMAMLVFTATTFYADAYFSDVNKRMRFWPLWLMLSTAINALLLSGDLFNLYVTLELLGLSAVALTALSDNRAALQASIRYLSIGLLGSA